MKEQIIKLIHKHIAISIYLPDKVEKLANEIEKLFRDDIDLAYCAGIFNTGGIDVLGKELERLKHIGRKPHQIFHRYYSIKTE